MIAQPDLTSKFALDTKSLGDLKRSAKAGSPEALRGAATQFEAMFINMMMKSMRDATPQDGVLDSQQTRTFTSMLDQQMSQKLAKRGLGLADMLVRQLSAQQANAQALAIGADPSPASASTLPALPDAATLMKTPETATDDVPVSTSHRHQPAHVRNFRQTLSADAELAERATGVPAKFMLGQAALETGWGKRVIHNADGSSSHNLFGIKAGPGWKGKVVTAATTEYINGRPHTKLEKFRSYDSYADAFKDYASMLSSNPRYHKVLAHGGDAVAFAHGLQRAGYATDPFYAAKLTRIIKYSLA
jgi:flagellar protein FlgJ